MNTTRIGRLARRPVAAAAVVAMVALSVAACGTTVRNAHDVLNQRADEGFDGTVGAAPIATAPGTTATSSSTVPDNGPLPSTGSGTGTLPPATGNSAPSGPSSAASTTGTSTTPASTGVPTPTTKATPHRAVPTGPAKLAPVEIGIIYTGDLGAFAKLFGASEDVGNLQSYTSSDISYINQHGGLDGHVLEPVYYSIPLTSTQPYSTTMAAVCSDWTQDHHVAAGVAVGFAIPDDLASCLSAKHIPYISGGTYLHDSSSERSIPDLVSPYEAGTDASMTSLVKLMLAKHWLTSKSRVGVLLGTNETAATDAYNRIVVPMLRGKVASVTSYGITYPPSTTAAVAESSTVSNDELHARANGVTNMLFLAPGAEGNFIQDAYQQHWYPKYAITSYDAPWALASAHTKEILGALTGSIGIGWQPTSDVGTYGSSSFSNATTKTCLKIAKPTGLVTNNIREFVAFQYCDALLGVQAAADASGAASVNGTSLLAGYNSLGTSHPDAVTFESRLTPQQHNGASEYRELEFNTGCRCFHYTGSITPF